MKEEKKMIVINSVVIIVCIILEACLQSFAVAEIILKAVKFITVFAVLCFIKSLYDYVCSKIKSNKREDKIC